MSELNFKGKEFVYNHHLTVPHRPLMPDADKSVGAARLDGNLIVQGDNLHALKSLLPMYAGKVDCIFIDPPYNTGNEGWCYNDNVNSPMMQAWLQANPVGIEDGLRHDKWCAMMWPRLRLLHELLGDAGSLWVTLDDNEIHRARSMLDSIFGEANFISCCVWQKRTSPDARKNLGAAHDYILVYAKKKPLLYLNKLPMSEMRTGDFSNSDKDPKGPWASVDLSAQEGHATKDQFYTIVAPNGKKHKPAEGRCWGLIESTYKTLFDEGRIWFGVDGNAKPRLKQYLEESGDGAAWTWWPNNEVGHTQEAKKEVLEIMESEVFETPKPRTLLERIFEIATEKKSLILDSFAGSGTTAHAVLAANKKDGGDRKFILVECEDYANKLTAERVRRVIKGYDFKGTQREELLRKSLTFTDLKKPTSCSTRLPASKTWMPTVSTKLIRQSKTVNCWLRA